MRLLLSEMQFGSSGCAGICTVGVGDKEHPNKMPFHGTLLITDAPSDKAPHGAEGHRIFVPKTVAKKRLSTLIDMGVNYTSELDSHAPRHKVGVITGAQIEGNKVVVNGFMWKKDFPEVEKDMKAGRLGMSMELSDVYVRSKDDPIWYLEDFHFSGATILFKSAAAYSSTSLAAAAGPVEKYSSVVELNRQLQQTARAALAALDRIEGGGMAKEQKKRAAEGGQGELLVRAISAGIAPAISAAIKESLAPFVTVLKKQSHAVSAMAASVDELKTLNLEAAKEDEDTEEIEAAGRHEEDDDMEARGHKEEEEEDMSAGHREEEDDDMSAAKGKKHEDDDEDEDEEDDSDLDAEMEHLEEDHADEEPGEVNEDAENRGDKTTRTGKIGKAKSMPIKASRSIRASSVIRELYASHRALRKKYRTLRANALSRTEALENKIEALEAQVEQYAERVDRKSVSPELTNYLEKQGVDVRELRAEGKKLSVAEVDNIFANAPVQLDPTTRMWFKNQLLEASMMEQGEVHRGVN